MQLSGSYLITDDYIVLESDSSFELTKKVREALESGYTIAGPHSCVAFSEESSVIWSQTVIKLA